MSNGKYLGTIKLVAGEGGWFDELTRIHLTLGHPQTDVYAGQNLTNVRKGVQSGRLNLVRGTLGPDESPYRLVRVGNHYELMKNAPTTTNAKKASKKTVVKTAEPPIKEETAKEVEAPVKEEVKPVEAPVAEEAPIVETPIVEEVPIAEATPVEEAIKEEASAIEEASVVEENSAEEATIEEAPAAEEIPVEEVSTEEDSTEEVAPKSKRRSRRNSKKTAE